jgi:hypothetical protein
MPYGNIGDPQRKAEWDALHELIREVSESIIAPDGSRLECIRGDHELNPGEIVSGIVRDLAESPLAIAVLAGHNANVFYELGVRHALANRTVLMAESENEVPFDLRTQRMLLFSTQSLAAIQQLRRKLSDTLRTMIVQSSTEPDNPIQRYLADRDQKIPKVKHAVDQVSELREEMREMRDALSDLIVSNMGNSAKGNFIQSSGINRSVAPSIMDSQTLDSEVEIKLYDNNHKTKKVSTLDNLVGSWINVESGSCAYAKFTNLGLEVVYCYCGDDEATGLYDNFQVVGSRIFACFHWINDPRIHGFTMLRAKGDDLLQGGWWYAHTVVECYNGGIPEIDEQHPEMIASQWLRIRDKKFPEWAEIYFDRRGN